MVISVSEYFILIQGTKYASCNDHLKTMLSIVYLRAYLVTAVWLPSNKVTIGGIPSAFK